MNLKDDIMTNISENLDFIKQQIKSAAESCGRNTGQITLIAVSKRKSVENIQECIDAGGNHFGENYIQEAVQKIDEIGIDKACWHFIGHLQSNKAKVAVKYFEYIHTVDTLKLAREIDKQASKIDKIQKVLLQVNISQEQTKSGSSIDEIIKLVKQLPDFRHIRIKGLMCMPPFFDDPELARPYFKKLVQIRSEIEKLNLPDISMAHLSMGMSNDFKVAIEEGSTMVRVGTSIFGRRD